MSSVLTLALPDRGVGADETGCLHGLFEAQARRRPEHPAVECRGELLTYGELDRAADDVALSLRAHGIKAGDLVALCSRKSIGLFAAMLGILKAGAAYVPLDPRTPQARIETILHDAEIRLVLADEAAADLIGTDGASTVLRIADLLAAEPDGPTPVLPRGGDAETACYVIFTSGSTGKPKGVVVEHRHAMNFVRALRSVYGVHEDDRILQSFSVAFDASVEEIWAAFSVGATLVVPADEISVSTFDVGDFIAEQRVTYFSTVPSFLALMEGELASVRTLVLGGEVCPQELVRRWATPGRRMFNTYGPTEATVVATLLECDPDTPVTIGWPLPGYTAHILDDELNEVGPGDTGELYIGGESVARGYLGRPDLTAAKFRSVALGEELKPVRLYRTHDLARRMPAGDIQFVGRADGQVKIRGFRVELGEIESVLAEQPGIRAAIVAAHDDGGISELAAYVVCEPGVELQRNQVAEALRARLPHYMVPRYLDVMASFPALTSGKADRRALPPPSHLLTASHRPYVAPASTIQRAVVAAFEAVLGQERISVDDDFFVDLHGHSMFAAKVITKLREDLGVVGISVPDLYRVRHARGLAGCIESAATASDLSDARVSMRTREVDESLRPSRFRYACVVLQLLALLLYYGTVWSPLAIAVILILAVQSNALGVLTALQIGTVAGFLLWPTWLALGIAIKWLVIGRYRPGRHKIWSFYYFRWWLAHRFQRLGWPEIFVGTPLMNLYYRAMGASVGPSCTIGTAHACAFDLLSIGRGTSVGLESHLLGYRVEGGWLRIGPIRIGENCFIGTQASLGLGSAMGDGSRLGDLSSLPDGREVPASTGMQGSPAEPVDVDLRALDDRRPASAMRRAAFGLLHLLLIYAMGYLLLGSLVPGLCVLALAFAYGGSPAALLAAVVIPPLSVATFLLLVVIAKKTVIGRIKPGIHSLYSFAYLRAWFLDYLLSNTRIIALPVYATLLLPRFLKLLGARIGKGVEISTIMHVMPDLLHVGGGGFIADAAIVGASRIHNGHVEHRIVEIEEGCFIGNSAMVAGGSHIGADSLIGVLSTPPVSSQAAGEHGRRWLGSPGLEVPGAQRMTCFDPRLIRDPTGWQVAHRSLVETVRILVPSLTASLALVFFVVTLTLGARSVAIWTLMLAVPLVATLASLLPVVVSAFVKAVVIGRFHPTVRPLWSPYVWLNEVVNAVYESNAAPTLAPMMGTPFLAMFLRLHGCRIGKWAFIETTFFSEFDLVDVSDFAALNYGATIQTHLFEDRVMKSDYLRIGPSCSVGNMAVVLYGSEMLRGSSISGLSVLMKGETLPASTSWQGIPTRLVPPTPADAANDLADVPPASRQRAHTGARRLTGFRLSVPATLFARDPVPASPEQTRYFAL